MTDVPAIVGKARPGKVTKRLIPTLLPGDIAIIDHPDLDRVAVNGLVRAGVSAVVNCSKSMTGAFANNAPLVLLEAGIPVIDEAGTGIFDLVADDEEIRIEGGDIFVAADHRLIASGTLLSEEMLRDEMARAQDRMDANLEDFAANTIEYIRRDKGKVLFNPQVPSISTEIAGKQVLVVARGPDYLEDLATLKSYINEVRPVIIAVDGGADAVIETGFTPDIIVGDMDSVSDSALQCGAEVIPHAYEDGTCTSAERLARLGIECTPWPIAATSEDLALILAWECNADLIVAVGTHSNLIEYLEKDRKGMASTFLVRLRVGSKLVDAKGVSKLYRPTPPAKYVWAVVGAALAAMVAAVLISAPLRDTLVVMWLTLRTHLGF